MDITIWLSSDEMCHLSSQSPEIGHLQKLTSSGLHLIGMSIVKLRHI